jgi:hypothetical protein
MQTQYEVNNLARVIFLSKLNYSPPLHSLDMAHLYPSNGTEGSSQNVASIWKVKDHGSCDVFGKCLIGRVCLSLMASTTVKMARSECALMEKQEQCKLRRN